MHWRCEEIDCITPSKGSTTISPKPEPTTSSKVIQMNMLNQLFTVMMIKIYFYLIGEESISRSLGEKVEMKTEINKVVYHCICQEIIFKASAKRWLSSYRVNRIYKVTMYSLNDETSPTDGTYPLLCPVSFVYTNYPHMLAIRAHYRLFYK